MAGRVLDALTAHVLRSACGFRHGIVPEPEPVEATFAEPPGFHNAFIGASNEALEHLVAGGFGRTRTSAECAAIAEALERYSAHMARFEVRRGAAIRTDALIPAGAFALFSDAQRAVPGFPHPLVAPDEALYARVFSLDDNRPAWVPEELVGLGSRASVPTLPSTSSGLAAGRDPAGALLRGVEELLERDAIASTWLASLGGREIAMPPEDVQAVAELGGEVHAFDVTQCWNPHPVVVVLGKLPLRGRPRFAMGAACRSTTRAAVEKALLEWLQGIVFAGHWVTDHPDLAFAGPLDARTFHDHGAYYTLRPEEWRSIPMLANKRPGPARADAPATATPFDAVNALRSALTAAGIRVFYRDLTLPDVRDVGLTVVRVLSPELSLLHGDEQLPFLGGRTMDVAWRYPHVEPSEIVFFNRHPHPLG